MAQHGTASIDTTFPDGAAALARPPAAGRTNVLALVIALLLTGAWAARDFAQLSAGLLPDTDDMMRLAQVRDWLAGQAYGDLVQHRLGTGEGASMHWSRIADLGPALLLKLLTPLLGVRTAELAMVIAWPAILLIAYLALMGNLARRLIGPTAGPVGVLVAALAFPAVTLFMPGRIDHHGLQIVLMLVLVRATVGTASPGNGLAAGAAAALSLAIGLETAPEIVAAMAALFFLWATRGHFEDVRVGGFAIGLGAATAALLAFARPQDWTAAWCDGFTPASSAATLVAAACWAALALAGRRFAGVGPRLAVGGAVAILGGIVVSRVSAVCISGPYGSLDPFLARVWMANVGEAGGLLAQPQFGVTIAYGGLCAVGLAAALHACAVRPDERGRWAPFTIFLVLGLAAALIQIRVTYIMAAFAALPLAAMVVHRREGGAVGGLVAAWLLATGFVYSAIGDAVKAVAAPRAAEAPAASDCRSAEAFRQLAQLPPGVVVASIDTGAYLIGMTPHRVLAAPYHRNNAGNLAMYRFFLAPPQRSRALAAAAGADYVMVCASDFAELDLGRQAPASLARQLLAKRAPDWLEPLPAAGDISVYRVR